MTYAVKKAESVGPLRWHVLRDDKFVVRYSTKTAAELHVQMGNGDASVAPEWYRGRLKYARSRMSERDAYRYAMGCAQSLGLSPATVQADPDTGVPFLPEEGGA